MTDSESEASKESVVAIALRTGESAIHDEDIRLVDRFLLGDQTAFEVLYARYYERVFALTRGIVLDLEETADVVQEIFTLAYKNLHKFDKRAKFGTWLFRIAVNRSIQQTRKIKRTPKTTELVESLVAPEAEVEDSDPRIYESLALLQPQDRAILTMFYWEEMSLGDIAGSLGCNINAAKTRLYRARERFKEHYQEEGL